MATATSSAGAARKGPFRLVTVNLQPERAKRIVSQVIFCASSWSPDESERIVARAQAARPGLRTYAVPHGLHGTGGPEAVAAHLAEQVGKLLS
ncbi:hypothetical protein SPI_05976 [Niveomyces insectorum RCEF 264]|uniref:Uncharacterized protein n=1 Tax=Niveomyces insectorum RCEF 264 TaxID=1081102 RepID=A0A167SNA8_9HYPO|nr:hypothetical protein SPI_05976 [Niveomyces insectorum RCEF 264]